MKKLFWQRGLACLLLAVFLTHVTAVPALADMMYDEINPAEEFTVDYVKYGFFPEVLGGTGVAVIDCDSNAQGELVIPSVVNGYKVFDIQLGALSQCRFVTSLSIELSENPWNDLFIWDFNSLTEINVSASMDEYNSVDGVLYNKNNRSESLVAYPGGKLDLAFNIPDGTTSIERGAFESAINLKAVYIPESVESIVPQSFGMTTDAYGKFDADAVMNTITIYGEPGSEAERFANENNVLFVKGKIPGNMFGNAKPQVFTTTFTEGPLTYQYSDVYDSYTLKSCDKNAAGEIIVPTNINGLCGMAVAIDRDAFVGCDKITSIFFEADEEVNLIFPDGFSLVNCDSLTEIKVSENIVSYTSDDGVLFYLDYYTSDDGMHFNYTNKPSYVLVGYPPGKEDTSYEIPADCEIANNNFFIASKNLKAVYAPAETVFYFNEKSIETSITLYGEMGSQAEEFSVHYGIPFIIGKIPQ